MEQRLQKLIAAAGLCSRRRAEEWLEAGRVTVNGCAARVEEGKNPICVDACPLRALDFGPIEDIRKKYDGVDSVPPLPDASYTHPNIVVKKCPAAARAKNVAGLVANPLEVM